MPGSSPLSSFPAIIWSISTVIEKRVSAKTGAALTSALVVGLGILPILIAYIFYPAQLSGYELLLSVGSGVFFAIGALLFYRTLETEQVSNTSASGFVQPALIIAFSIIVLREHLSVPQMLSGIAIVAGILLVITAKGLRINGKIVPALFANASWAIYWILASSAILASGSASATLLLSRVTTFVILAAMYFVIAKPKSSRNRNPIGTSILILACVAGFLDGAGNLIFGLLVKENLVAVASIFTTLSPLAITLLAYFVYKERLTLIQSVGMAIAIMGAFALALA
ncbi:MAG: EamA family transporter [Candidatus Micrarchaeota archaeon]|nr:EamA family transporter [Candidatus Micrarchaeota archaeon]MDE1847425.1 EamA family transporter [Candidatus Micrarchaeota archaeon]MDE1864080.1 EamA family transporter [Candidatus Micrarchaeota archaeon]